MGAILIFLLLVRNALQSRMRIWIYIAGFVLNRFRHHRWAVVT